MTPRVSVQRVRRNYGRRAVLKDVSFSCAGGEVAGIIGPNGAGKTTLLRIITGLLRADGGVVLLGDEPVPQALHTTRISYFAGESTVPPGIRAHTWRQLFVGAGRQVDRSRPVRLLSRGTRQMLGLRAALDVTGARVIVLDEPWEGLDPDAARWLTESIREKRQAGVAVVVSSHRLHDLASVCDRCVFLDDGVATEIAARDITAGGALTGDELLAAFDLLRGDAR